MLKVIITGSDSQLAKTLELNLNNNFGKFYFFNKKKFNLNNKSNIEKKIKKIKPNYIINTAALTNLEKIEKGSINANKINGIAPYNLALFAQKYNFTLIHISTDYVFDGKKNQYYLPKDKTRPLNKYGYSKMIGENLIKNNISSNCLIIRISWLYSSYKNNFLTIIGDKLLKGHQLSIVRDQFSHPTSANNLSNFIIHLIKNNFTFKKKVTVIHFRDSGRPTTPFLFAKYLKNLILKKNNSNIAIKSILYCQYNSKVVRPKYTAMNIKKTISNFNFTPHYWKDEIRKIVKEVYQ